MTNLSSFVQGSDGHDNADDRVLVADVRAVEQLQKFS